MCIGKEYPPFPKRIRAYVTYGIAVLRQVCFCDGMSVTETVPKSGDPLFLYAGTFTKNGSHGIYLFEMDRDNGKLTPKGLAAEAMNPSFLALHPNGRYLYATSEVTSFRGEESGMVAAFAIDEESGKLSLLHQQPVGGPGTCFVAVDYAGRLVLAANYDGGSVAGFPIEEDGRIGERAGFFQHEGSGPNKERQNGPHAHAIISDPSSRFALASDLGTDEVRVYRMGSRGELEPNEPPATKVKPGAGPRHLAFHPHQQRVYLVNELDSTVIVFAFDTKHGQLYAEQTISTLPPDFEGANAPAEILVHPNGRFLYASNRWHNTIVIFRIHDDGSLVVGGHESTQGKTPRNFCLDPSGRFLFAANQESDNIVAFRIDPSTGLIFPTGERYELKTPVCLRFR